MPDYVVIITYRYVDTYFISLSVIVLGLSLLANDKKKKLKHGVIDILL